MLAHPDFNYIPIETYIQEIFPTFILVHGVYITRMMNKVKVKAEVIANIQC